MMSVNQHSPKGEQIDKQVKRILNPSQSTQNILQQQFQSRIQSIEQCLTSRSNFLAMFQQMLQQQLQQNNTINTQQKHITVKSDSYQQQLTKINQINLLNQKYQLQSNLDTKKQQECMINTTNTFQTQQQLQLSQTQLPLIKQQKKIQQLNSFKNNRENEFIKQKQQQIKKITIIQNKKSTQIHTQLNKTKQQLSILQIKKQSILQIKKQSILQIKKLTKTIKSLHQQIHKLKHQQIHKLKHYIDSSFQFLKSYLLKQIFKSNLNRIVQIVHQSYSKKYDQSIKQMNLLNYQLKTQYQKQIHRLNQIIKDYQQNNQIIKQNQQNKQVIKDNQQKIVHLQHLNNQKLINFNKDINCNKKISTFNDIEQLSSIIQTQLPSFRPNINNYTNQQLSHNNLLNSKSINTNPYHNNKLFQQQIYESNSVINMLKYLNFTLNLPQQLPVTQTTIKPNKQKQFVTINNKLFSYQGYILLSQFTSTGQLELKEFNTIYEGEFMNHKFHGKGKLTINLTLNNINSLKQNNKQNIGIKSIKRLNENNIYVNNVRIVIIGKFINNFIQGYAKVILIDQNKQKINNNNSINQKVTQQSNTIFALWKNNKIVSIVS